jgi:hypothetical protein
MFANCNITRPCVENSYAARFTAEHNRSMISFVEFRIAGKHMPRYAWQLALLFRSCKKFRRESVRKVHGRVTAECSRDALGGQWSGRRDPITGQFDVPWRSAVRLYQKVSRMCVLGRWPTWMNWKQRSSSVWAETVYLPDVCRAWKGPTWKFSGFCLVNLRFSVSFHLLRVGQIYIRNCFFLKSRCDFLDIINNGHEGTGLVSVGRYTWFEVERPGEAVVNVVMYLWIP